MNDLLPPLYTEAALDIWCGMSTNAARLKRRVLIENPSTYLEYLASDMPEGDHLAEATRRSGCGLLLDVNNLYVNQRNHGTDPVAVMGCLASRGGAGEIHLAGHHVAELGDATLLIDNHGSPVCDAVWRLYDAAVARFPRRRRWSSGTRNIPPLDILAEQARLADAARPKQGEAIMFSSAEVQAPAPFDPSSAGRRS